MCKVEVVAQRDDGNTNLRFFSEVTNPYASVEEFIDRVEVPLLMRVEAVI